MEWDESTRRGKWVDFMMDIETIKRGNEKFLQSYHSKYKLPLWEIIFYCPFLRTMRTWEINSQNNEWHNDENFFKHRTTENEWTTVWVYQLYFRRNDNNVFNNWEHAVCPRETISMVFRDTSRANCNMKDSLIMTPGDFFSQSLAQPYYFIRTNFH